MWEPLTVNPPAPSDATTPGPLWPSPQSMVAVYADAAAGPPTKTNVPTWPENAVPAVALMSLAAAVNWPAAATVKRTVPVAVRPVLSCTWYVSWSGPK